MILLLGLCRGLCRRFLVLGGVWYTGSYVVLVHVLGVKDFEFLPLLSEEHK